MNKMFALLAATAVALPVTALAQSALDRAIELGVCNDATPISAETLADGRLKVVCPAGSVAAAGAAGAAAGGTVAAPTVLAGTAVGGGAGAGLVVAALALIVTVGDDGSVVTTTTTTTSP